MSARAGFEQWDSILDDVWAASEVCERKPVFILRGFLSSKSIFKADFGMTLRLYF